MIPWRSNQGRRLGESELSDESGADSTGGTTCSKTVGRTELDHSTRELLRAQRAISKAEAHGAAGSVPNSVQTALDSYASLDLWREPSGAHEAAGLSAAAGNAELPTGPRAAAAWEYPWPLHRQQHTAASGAARLAALQGVTNQLAAFAHGQRSSPASPLHHRPHSVGIARHLLGGDGGVHEEHQAGVAEFAGNRQALGWG